jgi:hypothetical protein
MSGWSADGGGLVVSAPQGTEPVLQFEVEGRTLGLNLATGETVDPTKGLGALNPSAEVNETQQAGTATLTLTGVVYRTPVVSGLGWASDGQVYVLAPIMFLWDGYPLDQYGVRQNENAATLACKGGGSPVQPEGTSRFGFGADQVDAFLMPADCAEFTYTLTGPGDPASVAWPIRFAKA